MWAKSTESTVLAMAKLCCGSAAWAHQDGDAEGCAGISLVAFDAHCEDHHEEAPFDEEAC